MRKDILIVDDEKDIRELISGILQDEGYDTRLAWDLNTLKIELTKRIPALILLDVWLENSSLDGVDLLKMIKSSYSNIPVIMISGHGTIDMAINALKSGAFDFLEKPFDTNKLLINIKRAIEMYELRKESLELLDKIDLNYHNLGKSQAASIIKSKIEKIAPTQSRVLLNGPSGSGKKFIAKLIHKESNRGNGPLIFANTKRILSNDIEKVLFGLENNDGVVVKMGLVEQAHQGTLYLDEICNLSQNLQSRLIKLLTENSYCRVNGKFNIDIDVRIISATSKDLEKEIREKSFSEDLYYRLNVVSIEIPSLRERIEDIPVFIDYFLKVCSKNLGLPYRKISKDSYNLLQSLKWSGNLKQLKNVIEQLLILAPNIDNEPINANILSLDNKENSNNSTKILSQKVTGLPLKKARELFEREYIKLQMHRFNNNVSKTAQFIGMERSALHRKLKTLNVKDSN